MALVLIVFNIFASIYALTILITFHYTVKYERKRIRAIGEYSLIELTKNSLLGPIFFAL